MSQSLPQPDTADKDSEPRTIVKWRDRPMSLLDKMLSVAWMAAGSELLYEFGTYLFGQRGAMEEVRALVNHEKVTISGEEWAHLHPNNWNPTMLFWDGALGRKGANAANRVLEEAGSSKRVTPITAFGVVASTAIGAGFATFGIWQNGEKERAQH